MAARFGAETVQHLRRWLFDEGLLNPYPSRAEKAELAASAAVLTMHQINMWFANARRRFPYRLARQDDVADDVDRAARTAQRRRHARGVGPDETRIAYRQ